MMFAVGIDVGGTFTRLAVVDHNGETFAFHRWATDASVSAEVWIAALADRIRHFAHKFGLEHSQSKQSEPRTSVRADTRSDLTSVRADARSDLTPSRYGYADPSIPLTIAVAVPGVLDDASGRVRRCLNIPALEGVDLIAELTNRLSGHATDISCVTVLTDADAAAWGEYQALSHGPARFAHLRIGTGVACGFVFDGRLHHPQPRRTTHLDVLQVMDGPEAIRCRCGLVGCLETIACGVTKRYDLAAGGIVTAIDSLVRKLGVEHIVLGGGVWEGSAKLRELTLCESADEKKRARNWNATVTCALLGDRAGAIGAAKIGIARLDCK